MLRLNIFVRPCVALCMLFTLLEASPYYNIYQQPLPMTPKPYVAPPDYHGGSPVHPVQPYRTPPYAVSSYAARLVPSEPAVYEPTVIPTTRTPVYVTEEYVSTTSETYEGSTDYSVSETELYEESSSDTDTEENTAGRTAELELETTPYETDAFEGTTHAADYVPPTTPPSPQTMATVVRYRR